MTTVLLVDDEPLVRDELGGILEDEGLTVLTAADGEEGLAAYLEHRPDMIITDAKMPRREGLSLARAVLAEDAHVPITMVTGHGNEKMAIEALRLGITDFIKKPVQLPDLLAAIDRMISAAELTAVRLDTAAALPGSARLVRQSRSYELDSVFDHIPAFVGVVLRDVATDLDNRRRDGLRLALRELVINAVEHGNLGLTYEQKSEATELGTLEELLEERAKHPDRCGRLVRVETTRRADQITIAIEDEGEGFDWQSLPDPTEPSNLLLAHGRGVLLAHLSVDQLSYNEAGNRVTLVIDDVGTPAEGDG